MSDELYGELFAAVCAKRMHVNTSLGKEEALTDALVRVVVRRAAEANATLRGTEYALLQAESVIGQALEFGDARAFDVLRSYGAVPSTRALGIHD